MIPARLILQLIGAMGLVWYFMVYLRSQTSSGSRRGTCNASEVVHLSR